MGSDLAFPSVCARCPAALGHSCCEVRPDEKLATLTCADVERVRVETGLAEAAFCEEDWLTEGEALRAEQARPLYAGYFQAAPLRLTLRREGGACVFHQADRGCRLSRQGRPVACLLYPFELWPGGEWSVQMGRFGSLEEARRHPGQACLAVEEADGMDAVLAAFGVTREAIESLGARLREEVLEHGRRARRR
jgi:Fe-S-cluster containining protein